MALHIPYTDHKFRPEDGILPGNSTSEDPVEFTLVPAWGSDKARLKSICYATLGLAQTQTWTPDIQEAVVKAFDMGAPVFQNTVTAIRGLSVPNLLAARAGLIDAEKAKQDPQGKFAILHGLAFAAVCGTLTSLAYRVAMEISKISGEAELAMDPRFFEQPSGSGGATMAGKAKGSNVRTARRRSNGRETAASGSPAST